MTREELEEQIERAVTGFSELDGVADEVAEALVGEGFLSYDDLSVIEPENLMEMGDLTEEQVDHIVTQAEAKAEEAEQAALAERRRQREQERIERATREAEELERSKEEAAQAEAAAQSEAAGEEQLGEPGASGDSPITADASEGDASEGDASEGNRQMGRLR